LCSSFSDSHMNAYVRMKLALTEDEPTIKPYDEARWAELSDGKSSPIEPSLAILESFAQALDSFAQVARPARLGAQIPPPGSREAISLDDSLALYAWHGKHHVAHITSLRQRNGWQ